MSRQESNEAQWAAVQGGPYARLRRFDGARAWTVTGCSALIAGCDLVALWVGLRVAAHVPLVPVGLYVALVALLLCGGRLWTPRITLRVAEDAPAILGRLAVALFPFMVALQHDSRLAGLLDGAPIAAVLLIAGRAFSYRLIIAARKNGMISQNTLILGARGVGAELATVALEHPEYGLRPIGFLDGSDQAEAPIPILGDVQRLGDVLKEFEVDRVLVAFSGIPDGDMVSLLQACGQARAEIHVVPRLFEASAAPHCRDTDDLWGIPVVRLRRAALRSVAWRAKRVLDVVLASVALVASAPAFVLVAMAVRLTSPGPALFRQHRVGKDGRGVMLLMFRTLQVNGDSDTTWSVANDMRQTGIGRLLRKTSLDELPQLLNVLRGEMSLVGPRPERPHFVSEFSTSVPHYQARHRVPAGMTGWAQVHGLRGDTSLSDRARFDNQYIERWSFWGDVVILMRTFTAIGGEITRDAELALRARCRQLLVERSAWLRRAPAIGMIGGATPTGSTCTSPPLEAVRPVVSNRAFNGEAKGTSPL